MKLTFKNLKHHFKTIKSQSQIASLLNNYKFNYGQQQLKTNIAILLQHLYHKADTCNLLLLIGKDGLGKSIIAREIFHLHYIKLAKLKLIIF